MEIWSFWLRVAASLRPAFPRVRTFHWFLCAVCGFCVRSDLLGVTSFVRCLGLEPWCYDRLLDMFHCTGLDFRALRRLWVHAVLGFAKSILLKVNGRVVLLADGQKVPKSGKKMPAVKKLHQESESNTKPEYIFGHSLQAVSIAVKVGEWLGAIPLGSEIHEGVVFSNRCRKTLLDRLLEMLASLGLGLPAYYVLDAYYGAEKIVVGALAQGAHIITRMKGNVVAYLPIGDARPGRGRPRKYGDKLRLSTLFGGGDGWTRTVCQLYGKETPVRLKALRLLWRPAGRMALFVLVEWLDTQERKNGRAMFMSTDLTLSPREVVELYAVRFKIEVGFKAAARVVGSVAYHFWMMDMKPIGRKGGNQYLHRESEPYRAAVRRKIRAFHNFMQCGIVAQGIMVMLSALYPTACWSGFGSWMRTMRLDGHPSEWTVAHALRNALPDFLASMRETDDWAKFLCQNRRHAPREKGKAA